MNLKQLDRIAFGVNLVIIAVNLGIGVWVTLTADWVNAIANLTIVIVITGYLAIRPAWIKIGYERGARDARMASVPMLHTIAGLTPHLRKHSDEGDQWQCLVCGRISSSDPCDCPCHAP